MHEIPKDTSVKNLLTDIMPALTKRALDEMPPEDQAGTGEISLTMEVSGNTYSYRIKNNEEIEISERDMDAPMVRVVMSNDDLEKMIAKDQLDLLLGITTDLNKSKADTINSLKGTVNLQLGNDDGSAYAIKARFNNEDSPVCDIDMKTADSLLLVRKQANPVMLFMSGGLKLKGDMPFAMRFQNLFI